MVKFSTFIWKCIQIWNCTNKRNLDKLYKKSNVLQFFYTNKLNYILFHVSLYDIINLSGITAKLSISTEIKKKF